MTDDLEALAGRLEAIEGNHVMRFSVCQGRGWITSGSEATIRTLCEVYNNRKAVAAALRRSAA
jgi:hypothetical protein